MRKHFLSHFVATLLFSLLSIAPASAQNSKILVQNGKDKSVILVPVGAKPDESQAAKELQEYLQKISGAQVLIKEFGPTESGVAADALAQGKVPIVIGASLDGGLLESIRAKGTDPASFILKTGINGVQVAGLSPEGTLFGVYELLEQLGVRWFMPGELGTVIPSNKTVTLREQETIQVPSFNGRYHNAFYMKEWGRHNRMGGPYFPPAHGFPGITRADFKAHPEYFAEIGGKRYPYQLDVSNPEVVRIVTGKIKEYFRKNPDVPWIGIGPDDGAGFCECSKCRALDGGDWDPFSNEPSVTDRYIWFFNQLLDGIKDEFPGKKICFYSYHTYMRAPVKTKPNPLIVPAFAPIALCRIHGMSNPLCPERSYYKQLMADWGKILPEVYERGYWFNLADPGFPFGEVHKMRDEIPIAHGLGIKGWRVETMFHWGSETPSLYIAPRLMWNHKADVDALLADFYEKFFGPASKPMGEYLTMMDNALRDADYHTGCSFDMPHLYPKKLRDEARKRLNAATKSGGTGIYGKRVTIFRTTFNYVDEFINMMEQSTALNFNAAKASHDKLMAHQKALVAYDPPMVSKTFGPLYMQRFFSQPVEQAFARTTGGNTLVAALQDEWLFQLDSLKTGEDTNLWRAESRGMNWQKLKTSSQSWSNQGLRLYKGEAWYRQEVDIPARFAGQRVFLWFGGVDETAKVWVNGQLLGISHGGSFLPFEMDASNAIKPGARNVVTVRIVNQVVDELGTGGITAPAFFYAPKAGKDAKLENVADLKRTFP